MGWVREREDGVWIRDREGGDRKEEEEEAE